MNFVFSKLNNWSFNILQGNLNTFAFCPKKNVLWSLSYDLQVVGLRYWGNKSVISFETPAETGDHLTQGIHSESIHCSAAMFLSVARATPWDNFPGASDSLSSALTRG